MNYLRIECENRVIIESVADQPNDTVVMVGGCVNTSVVTATSSLWIVIGLAGIQQLLNFNKESKL
ncbi:hypothetical protein DPV78_002053 [Talaromyces pinophilus]|nr:hypothetical protein DPV78_002053 [Talaromyces pinophilus]